MILVCSFTNPGNHCRHSPCILPPHCDCTCPSVQFICRLLLSHFSCYTHTPLISGLMPCPAVPSVLVEMFGMCVVGRRVACAGLTVLILSFSLIPGVCWHFHIFSIPIITVYTTEILFGCFNYKKSDYSDLPNYLFESAVIWVTAVAV